jgi:predicted nucleic acid-binding protein
MKGERPPKAYLDTSIVVSFLFGGDLHHAVSRQVFAEADKATCMLIVSDLVLLELASLYGRLRDGRRVRLEDALRTLLQLKNVRLAETKLEPLKVLKQRRLEGVTPMDRLHIQAAEALGCDFFLTLDRALLDAQLR